ncbi:hypothetical protein GEMRC1_011181 [Eukaryota sp. GEM-RC1]
MYCRSEADSLITDVENIKINVNCDVNREVLPQLSQYTKVSKVGSGSSGDVWLCLNAENHEVAMKIISFKNSLVDGTHLFPTQTLREIAILQKLVHPNVLRLHDFIVEHETQKIYIITEFCDMGPIVRDSDIGSNKPIKSSQIRKIFRQIVAGLHYIHSNDITHNDIKPSNILLSRCNDGSLRAVIADFGISSSIGRSDSLHQGSPLFIAPEILTAASGYVNVSDGTAADVYALGVSLYIMTFGRSPWGNISTSEALLKCITEYVAGDRCLYIPLVVAESQQELITSLMHPYPDKRPSLKEILTDTWLLTNTSLPPDSSALKHISRSTSLSKLDKDNAATVASNIDFETRQGVAASLSTHLTEAQRNLLVFHSTVKLLNLCTRLLDLAGAHCSPSRTHLTQQLQSWTSACCEINRGTCFNPSDVSFTSLQYGLAFVDWAQALGDDVMHSLTKSDMNVFKMKQLQYIKNKVLYVLKQRVQELVLRLRASASCPNREVDFVGPWRYFKAKNICKNLKAVFDAISSNPNSHSKINFVSNGYCVSKPISSAVPVHTIFLDVGESDLNRSDSSTSSSGDVFTKSRTFPTDKDTSNPVYLPTVAVDILRELICNARKYSPPNTVIRAAVWNQMNNDENYLHICVNDAGVGMNDPNASIQSGTKEDRELRPFGRGFGLTECFVTVTSFLNGTFAVDSIPEGGTSIHIVIPVPKEDHVSINVQPSCAFSSFALNSDDSSHGSSHSIQFATTASDSDYSDVDCVE